MINIELTVDEAQALLQSLATSADLPESISSKVSEALNQHEQHLGVTRKEAVQLSEEFAAEEPFV